MQNPVILRLLVCALLGVSVDSAQGGPVDYPIVAVKSERPDDETDIRFAEVFDPVIHPPSDLVILHPDGREEMLVSGHGVDALFDTATIDGINVYYVKVTRTLDRNPQRRQGGIARAGGDIYSINIETKEITRWTEQTQAPPQGFARWYYKHWVSNPPPKSASFGYAVFNIGPQPLPDGRLIYTSSRRRLAPTKGFTFPCLQLHARHPDGRVECIGVMSQGSALHPELLRDGRIAYSSYETMGLRDSRLWALWQIHPDGTNWGPLVSAFNSPYSYHFHCQRSNGRIVVVEYYNKNNNGFGSLLEIDEFPTYGDPDRTLSEKVPQGFFSDGKPRYGRYSFVPSGLKNLTPWATPADQGSAVVDGQFVGKVTHPSAAPDNDILLVYTPGPANDLQRPTPYPRYHGQIRLLEGERAKTPKDLKLIKSDPNYNYTQPLALVNHKRIYGRDPVALPDTTDQSQDYGIFGSADAFAGQWAEAGNNPKEQGLDPGGTPPATSLLILAAEPNVAKIYGWDMRGRQFSDGTTGWWNGINERLRILGEYKFDQPDRPKDDYSFRVKVPADTPLTVAIRGKDGRFLTCGQSWKQVRPGTSEVKCGGCHNHAGEAISTEGKYAFSPGYQPLDFTLNYRIPEYNKDVKPIFERHCVSCHNPEGEAPFVLDESIARSDLVLPLRAGKSPLSHRLRGEHGLKQMPLGKKPLSTEEIHTIEEWIDLGALVDDGSGSAFDVLTTKKDETEAVSPKAESSAAVSPGTRNN